MRLLALWVLPCILLKIVREVIRLFYVHHEAWWQSAAILFAFIFSWTYVATVFLSSCILFYLVCNLQVIHFEDYGKLLEREANVLVLIQEHARLRYYLSKISHRFRIYLILQFVIVTISQFMALSQTTEYNGRITFVNGGDFAVSSSIWYYIFSCSERVDSIGNFDICVHAITSLLNPGKWTGSFREYGYFGHVTAQFFMFIILVDGL